MDLSNLVESLIGSSAGGAAVLAVARWYLGRLISRLDTLESQLEVLKGQRVGALEVRMDAFEKGCEERHDRLQQSMTRFEHMAADLANIVGWTKKLDGKLDRIAEQNAQQSAEIQAKGTWLQNLDNAHQAHVRDREIHAR